MFKSQYLTQYVSVVSIKERTDSLVQVLGASLLIGLCAQIKIPLFFSPVPLTLQTFAVLLIGGILGAKKGIASVLLYFLQGFVGLPVFSGGASGLLYFMGPVGGYLIGFILQAYLVGWWMERQSVPSSGKLVGFLFFACLAQMTMGMLWLAHFVGWNHAFSMGLYPFIPGEVLKSLLVAKALPPSR
jgi:biotin transport system substrate-specific component